MKKLLLIFILIITNMNPLISSSNHKTYNFLIKTHKVKRIMHNKTTDNSSTTKNNKLKVGFLLQHLMVRGVDVAVYDYADLNETMLGNESFIFYIRLPINWQTADMPGSVREKFKQRFGARFYECADVKAMDKIISNQKIDIFYALKHGMRDDFISKVCNNAMHAVFPPLEPHGNVYASISSWLSNEYPSLNIPYVPHMIRLADTTETLHQQLHIPKGSVVFGRHGGFDTFDIDFARQAVREIATKHRNWYFIFLNTEKFCNLPNVIFLPSTPDLVYKTKFINTCDIMLHARKGGESFGLSCGEFSIKNKAVITYFNSPQRAHIEILGTKGLYYKNKQELLNILNHCGTNINQIRTGDWDAYSKDYNPTTIMKKFNDVFIQPLITKK